MARKYYRTPKRYRAGYKPYVSPYTKAQSVPRDMFRYSANQKFLYQPPDSSKHTYVYSKSKTGNYLRNWRDIVRAGGNATTAFSAWEHVLDRRFPVIYVHNDWRPNQFNPWQKVYSTSNYVNLFHADLAPFSTHLVPGVAQKAQDRAATELVKKINRAHHQLQGGVILGEIDKTARLLTGTARKLKQGVFSYIKTAVGIRNSKPKGKKGRALTASQVKNAKTKAIANSYLEATFGWSPLIHDAKDLAKTLGRLTTESDRVRFRAGAEWEEQYSQAVTRIGNPLWADRTVVKKTVSNVVYRGFLRGLPYEAGSPPLERIVTMSGFDLRSFVPTMWELVPYSFLVDYFTNIGECLQSWTLDTSVVKVLWRTQITESIVEVRIVPDVGAAIAQIKLNNGTNGQSYSGYKQDGLSSFKYRTVTRDQAAVPLLVPQLTGLDLEWRQFANIGALMTKLLR